MSKDEFKFYDHGWNAFVNGEPFNVLASRDWHDGWDDAADAGATDEFPDASSSENFKTLDSALEDFSNNPCRATAETLLTVITIYGEMMEEDEAQKIINDLESFL